jgi:hypothetical protein
MIHEIAKSLDTALRAKGVPLRVVDGPERTGTTSFARERVTLERDRDRGDSFGPTRSQHGNPRARLTRTTGCVLRVYAQSTHAGATVQDHERRAETVLDRVLVALDTILRGERMTFWTQASGRFMTPADLEETETFAGAVYELRFTVDRSVFDRTWPTAQDPEGAARPEGGFDGVGNILEVPLPAGGTEQIPFGAGA